MAPLICLFITTLVSEIVRQGLDWNYLQSFADSVRLGLSMMFILTGVAHFNRMKEDLVRMVPAWIPNPRRIVFITGIIELVGALLLLVPQVAPFVSLGFVFFLAALFPANVKAARAGILIGGRKALGLVPRGLIQLVFISACLIVAFSSS